MHRAGGVEVRRVPAQTRELRAAARGIARLVEHSLAAGGDLVAADDQGLGVSRAPPPAPWRSRGAAHGPSADSPAQVLFADSGRHHLEVAARAARAARGGRGRSKRGSAAARSRSGVESPSRNNGLAPNPALTWADSIPIIRAPCRSPGRGRSKSTGWPTAEPRSTLLFRSRSCAAWPARGCRECRGACALCTRTGACGGGAHAARRGDARMPAMHAADERAHRHGGRVALVASEADVARVPAELEPVLAPGGRISIARAHHGGADADTAHRGAARRRCAVCGAAGRRLPPGSADQKRTSRSRGLADLLKR